MDYAEKKGIKKGEKRGIVKGEKIGYPKNAIETALTMIEMGFSSDKTSKTSKLSIEEIEELRENGKSKT